MTTSSNSDLENEITIKQSSDTSLLSEGSENLTDYSSETSSLRKVKFAFKKKTFDTKYPRFVRSKSLIMKHYISDNKITNIVNEEQNEDGLFRIILDRDNDDEKIIKIPKKKFIVDIKSDLDLPVKKFRKLKGTKSFRESFLQDSLYVFLYINKEIKEEQCPNETAIDKKSILKLQSPQMKFLTDNIEDMTVCPTYLSSNHVSSFKYNNIEEEQVIKEDNNENNLECVEMKKNSSNKKLENFIDKLENFEDQIGMKKTHTDNIIETIKEENVEEEEITDFHQNNISSEYPVSDELSNVQSNIKYRLSIKGTNMEENKVINELDDEF